MKRFITTAVLFTAFAVLFATPAFAGVKDWILDNALTSAVTLVFIAIGALFGGKKWGQYAVKAKVPILELTHVAQKVRDARKEKSPGGKTITDEEKAAIWKEVEDVVYATIEAVTGQKPARQ